MKPTRWRTLICDLTEECDQKDYPVKQGHPIEAAEDEGDNLIGDVSSNLFEAEGGDQADREDGDGRQFVINIDRGVSYSYCQYCIKSQTTQLSDF